MPWKDPPQVQWIQPPILPTKKKPRPRPVQPQNWWAWAALALVLLSFALRLSVTPAVVVSVTPAAVVSGFLGLSAIVSGFIGWRVARNPAGRGKWMARMAMGFGAVMMLFILLPPVVSVVLRLFESEPEIVSQQETQKPKETQKPTGEQKATVPPEQPKIPSTDNPLPTTNPIDGAEMIYIPAGEFIMGTSDAQIDALLRQFPNWSRSWFDDEKPQRRVYLDGYYIYKYEVTVAQYSKFCNATGRQMPSAPSWGWQDNHPIVNVTYDDAVEYCKWARVELPTEAQWEKAARGTDGRIWPWGNKWDANKCNNSITGPKQTTPVGSYTAGASPYGVMDMAGNVWEWCKDWYDENYYASAPSQNPLGPSPGTWRVLRGGSWFYADPVILRAANRNWYGPVIRNSLNGFRGVALRLPR